MTWCAATAHAMYLRRYTGHVRALARATRTRRLLFAAHEEPRRTRHASRHDRSIGRSPLQRSMPGPIRTAWASMRSVPTIPVRSISALQRPGATTVAWYGVRLFTDHWAQQLPGNDFPRHSRRRRGGRTAGPFPLSGCTHPHHRSARSGQRLGPCAALGYPLPRVCAAKASPDLGPNDIAQPLRATSGPVIRFKTGKVDAMTPRDAKSPPNTAIQYVKPGTTNERLA